MEVTLLSGRKVSLEEARAYIKTLDDPEAEEVNVEQQVDIESVIRFNANVAATGVRQAKYQPVIDMYLAGHTLQEVGNQFGVSRERVRQILVKFNITARRTYMPPKLPPKPKWTPELREAREIARFWSRIDITVDPDECWNWKMGCHESGYPWSAGPRMPWHTAHGVRGQVAVWYLTYGVKPKGWVTNICRNRKCLNPRHLGDFTDKREVMKYRGKAKTTNRRDK